MMIDITNFKRLIVTYNSPNYTMIKSYDKKVLNERFKIDNYFKIPNTIYWYNEIYIIDKIYFEK